MNYLTERQINEIIETSVECGNMIEDRLTQIVKAIGEDYSEAICGEGKDAFNYYREEFGMDEEDEKGVKITKVLNFYDNGGCVFTTSIINSNEFTTSAFYALYIVETKDEEQLKYYRFYNDDTEYNSDTSEPDHDYVSQLNLSELMYLMQAILDNFSTQELKDKLQS